MKPSLIESSLGHIERFFESWRFPSFMLITLTLFWILMVAMAFMPVSDTAWGAFAEDFKVWCFGYDPATGSMEVMYLVMFTLNPLMLSLIIWFVWLDPLKELLSDPKRVKPYAASSLLLVSLIALSFLWMARPQKEQGFEFRPESLRISQTPPAFTLINNNSTPVSLGDYSGKVVILTSIYSTCSETCLMLMEQAINVMKGLTDNEQEEAVLIAITMQPERDTPERLERMAGFYKLKDYHHEMLTGEPELVHRVLDEIGIRREVDKESGRISHTNLFLVIGRDGRIAFRFSLGERQEEWMTEAVKMLIGEDGREEMVSSYE